MSPELAATHWGTALLHWLPLPLQLSPCWTKPVCGTTRLAFESVFWMAALRGLTFLLLPQRPAHATPRDLQQGNQQFAACTAARQIS